MNSATAIPLALVTGSTSGIGLAFAERLAAEGYNLLLVARHERTLTEVAQRLENRHNIKVEVMAIDLSDQVAVAALCAAIGGRDVALLINNAGVTSVGDFWSIDPGTTEKMVDLHLQAALRLTYAVLPNMLSRRAGRLVMISSVYAFFPAPGQAVYGATKAFLYHFASALQAELRGTGVGITCVCPGATRTNLRKAAGRQPRTGLQVLSPEQVVDCAFRQFRRGTSTFGGRFLVIPGLRTKILVALLRLVPRSLQARLVARYSAR